MSVQTETSPAPGRGNALATGDITPAESPSSATNGDEDCSSGNSVSPPSQEPTHHQDQAGAGTDEESTPVLPKRSTRVEAPPFELLFEETEQLPVSDIHADSGIQLRARMDNEAVEDYAYRMKEGDTFPAVIVFHDGVRHWLADGFHRLAAARQAGLDTITAKVKSGGRQDAIRYALGANFSHGLRRTNADKRRAVEIALKEFADLSDRQIAELCGVGNQLVGDVRRQVCESHTSPVRTGRDGKKYPERTPAGKELRPEAGLDQAPTEPSIPADPVPCPGEPSTELPMPNQVPPTPLHFSLADGSDFEAAAWTDGWIDTEAAAIKIRSLEATAKPMVSVDKEACALHQRVLLGFCSTLNRELGSEPSHDSLHRLHDALDSMACLLRNTVVGHRNYHPVVRQISPVEDASYADDDHNDR